MGKKSGVNEKVAAALEKKAENQRQKDAKKSAVKEAKESEKWSQGAKDLSKKEQEEQKRLEKLAKKAERFDNDNHREALLQEEEESVKAKPIMRGPGKIALKKTESHESYHSIDNLEKFTASNVDDALELLKLTDSSEAKASDKIDRHPERRVKSAYAIFEEREMPILKEENPTLRMTQLKQMLQKKWKKSPENPMNQQNLAFNASREEEKEFIQSQKRDALNKFRE